jgi:hypothetical protein
VISVLEATTEKQAAVLKDKGTVAHKVNHHRKLPSRLTPYARSLVPSEGAHQSCKNPISPDGSLTKGYIK